MRLDVVSLAPEAFAPLQGLGVIGRAFAAGRAELHVHNPRDYATDRPTLREALLANAKGEPTGANLA